MTQRLRNVPSSITGELRGWLSDVATMLNAQPFASVFSGTTPNSVVTGIAGDMAVNVGSASTDSRFWVKGGDPTVPSQLSWVVLRIAQP